MEAIYSSSDQDYSFGSDKTHQVRVGEGGIAGTDSQTSAAGETGTKS